MQIRRSFLGAVAMAAAALFPVGAAAQSSSGEPAAAPAEPAAAKSEPQRFKDWSLTCEKPKGADHQQCYIFQNLVLKKGGQRVLNVAVGHVIQDGSPAALFTLPLGISLPSGIGMKIDENEPVRFPVERCQPNGCIAPLRLTDELLAALKAGKQAKVAFRDSKRREIVVPVSLSGFTAAFDALEK